MTRKLIVIIGILLFSTLLYFTILRIIEYNKKSNYSNRLPNLTFEKLDGSAFNFKSIDDKNVIVMFFSPDCEFCTEEINDLIKNIEQFNNTVILMISPSDTIILSKFYQEFEINKYENVIVLKDSIGKFKENFGSASIPTTILFNRNKEKLFKAEGSITSKRIVEIFNNGK
jgi:thiol-disulfide isomerase/thioredoxin